MIGHDRVLMAFSLQGPRWDPRPRRTNRTKRRTWPPVGSNKGGFFNRLGGFSSRASCFFYSGSQSLQLKVGLFSLWCTLWTCSANVGKDIFVTLFKKCIMISWRSRFESLQENFFDLKYTVKYISNSIRHNKSNRWYHKNIGMHDNRWFER